MVREENILVTKVSDLREEEMDSQVKAGRQLLLLGIAGSVLWLLADIVLGYLPGGIAKAGFMSDAKVLETVLEGAPLWRFPVSAANRFYLSRVRFL